MEKVVEEKHEDSGGDSQDIETASSRGDRTEAASVGDIGETADSGGFSPLSTRSGKARKTKDRLPFYKGWKGEGVVYLPGDIHGIAKKLELLAAEFFAGNTTVTNELVHVLNTLLRLKQLTRKEYTNITARLGVWNCQHDLITSRSICNKSYAGYSCKGGTERFTESSQESRSKLDCT